MEERGTAKQFTRRDEQRLLKIATDSLRSAFPNPERNCCPQPEAIHAIATRHLEFPEADDIVDHIASCSPCFREYTAHRRRYRLRLVGGTALCCVAVFLLAALFWRFVTPLRPQKENVAQQPSTVFKAELDFRNRTVQRSDRPQSPNEPPTPHLRRALLDLSIRLPIGMEDGSYSIQFRNQFGQSLVNTTGTAAWDGTAETLRAAVDLRSLPSGDCIVAIRRGISTWREYTVVLD